ncbi:winged helix-turn-helix domain-containing protein [Denitrobacterium detoxificans]|uniref:winged helix-turn-helix domain-containing protein n=1 Tax=Denitrobacterium detoxificans TaxID=79604 RepID=UPI0026F08DF2|nr:LysR family transcriptional regulator [Denitrobacterium detoxificans]MBE6466211.1 LysR family transcriptional regulator [Denitrobacterium detoxificans]
MTPLDLKPTIKLSIMNPLSEENALFGPGIAALCRGVRSTGSLNAAAKNMGMAYSKAWRIIKETEESLGMQMLVRDGAHGSTLTDECITLLDAYDNLSKRLQVESERLYKEVIS